MNKKLWITSGIYIILIIALIILYFQFMTGNPLIPRTYDLICTNSSGRLQITLVDCFSDADCIQNVPQKCQWEHRRCNNDRLICKDNECKIQNYFKIPRRCE